MSTIRFLGMICLTASLYAQSSDYFVEFYDPRTNAMIERVPVTRGQLELLHVPAGSFSVRLVTAPGAAPILEEYHEFERGGAPLVLDVPERVVSLRELQHPVSRKASREAYQAQQLVRANKLPAAIAKLEKAIRIDPSYRDAHCNLGVLYARSGRGPEALAEFQKALDIGPPSAPIYADLALVCAAMRLFPEAESSAREALELDPANGAAQRVLELLPTH